MITAVGVHHSSILRSSVLTRIRRPECAGDEAWRDIYKFMQHHLLVICCIHINAAMATVADIVPGKSLSLVGSFVVLVG